MSVLRQRHLRRFPSVSTSTTAAILLMHVVLIAWIDLRNSPTIDELGHLAAGIATWKLGTFDIYRVNPPLVRTIAAFDLDNREQLVDISTLYALFQSALSEKAL